MLSHMLTGLIDEIHGDTITLRELLERSGRQGMLLICALSTLPFLIPVSIPGVSTVFGAAIVLLASALFLNRLPWLPQRILNKPLDAHKLVPVLRKGAGLVSKIDRWVKERWLHLTSAAMLRLNSAAVVFGGLLLMAPLGPIPFQHRPGRRHSAADHWPAAARRSVRAAGLSGSGTERAVLQRNRLSALDWGQLHPQLRRCPRKNKAQQCWALFLIAASACQSSARG